LKAEDYPALYNQCSACAECNQKNHYKILKIRIGLLIAIAGLGGIAWNQIPGVGIVPPLIIAISFLIMFIFTIIMENKKFEKNWQITRAAAETIKQESWFYMMKTYPYLQQKGQEARMDFMKFLKKIVESKMLPIIELNQNHEGNQITEVMDKLRNADFEERKQFYLQNRISDQRSWYARKAKINRTKESQLTLLMWLLLSMGVAFSFVNVVTSALQISLPLNVVGLATTSTAALLSWISARSYRELSYSYSSVAQELSFIEETAKSASNEDQLAKVVEEAEGIMSQEHELWKTKRQIALP
jgi:hypothetical protein